jgi:hypothetical protein
VVAWPGLIWLSVTTGGGLLWTGNRYSSYINERLSASQGGLCSMELVNLKAYSRQLYLLVNFFSVAKTVVKCRRYRTYCSVSKLKGSALPLAALLWHGHGNAILLPLLSLLLL